MKRTFVGLPYFEREWRRIGLTDEDRRGLEIELLEDPTKGDLITGAGGIRKLRRPLPGTGKSGGIRVFYYDDGEHLFVLLLAVIKKGEKENLTKSERNELAKLIQTEIVHYRSKK
jgi:mRNA-degrading endonuclease RelE of RelBE toxin-antitoxin system